MKGATEYKELHAIPNGKVDAIGRFVCVCCRFTFYERKRERRNTRIKGLLLATAIGVGDYIAAII